ncbi:thrombospondin type 3 repeat-containing protein [Roseimarinus sediminis]|uniref:thrombospondin type 3 repeat-containing protein n=1 Tax=Roseimarinus sediminis TaxID=1610899 RepID=UPI003D1B5C99
MIRLIVYFGMCLMFLGTVSAQNYDKNWGLNIDYGSIEYRGELGDQFGDFSQWQGGYGINVSRYLSPLANFGVRGAYNYLHVFGPEEELYSMQGDMLTIMGLLELKVANGVTLREDAALKPYFKLGAGKMFGKTWGLSMNSNENYEQPLNDWIYSVGGGFRLRLSDHIDAFADVSNLWVTAVGMDGSTLDAAKDQFIQMNIGLSFALGSFKDSDRDGVGDKQDLCPDTPANVEVDVSGCPLDGDGDGIPDFQDQCPDEAGGTATKGCPDRDNDGLADQNDRCPDEAGPKSNGGCPLAEKQHEEAAAPANQALPAGGVNIFFVYPGEGQGAPQIYSIAPGQSMAFDSDGDGIANNIDRCPDEPGPVDHFGCPEAPSVNQATGSAVVNPLALSPGCPSDRDCDGISDAFDECPDEPGAIRNKG